MKFPDIYQQKKIFVFGLSLACAVLLALILARVFLAGEAEVDSAQADFTEIKYQSALKKLDDLKKVYQEGVLTNPLFLKLVSVFRLPLEAGSPGKDNPFLLPPPPEEILKKKR